MPDCAERRPDPSLPGGLAPFFASIGILALIRVGLGYLSFPLDWLPAANLVLAAIFLGIPVLGLFFASNSHWRWQGAAAFVACGLVVQIGLVLISTYAALPPQAAGIVGAVAQGALACWCVGLGALLATRIKEKNMLLPVAVFLAAYDFFLVLTPWGFTQKLLKVAQPAFSKVAGTIPAASAAPTHGLAHAGAYIGMADFVFLAMFFVALFRFRMRTRATLLAVLPALLLYMIAVLAFGDYAIAGISLSALPAMVPIGAAVLATNWREFDLKRDEKIATAVLAVLMLAFLVFAATRPKPQVEPEPPVSGQAPPR